MNQNERKKNKNTLRLPKNSFVSNSLEFRGLKDLAKIVKEEHNKSLMSEKAKLSNVSNLSSSNKNEMKVKRPRVRKTVVDMVSYSLNQNKESENNNKYYNLIERDEMERKLKQLEVAHKNEIEKLLENEEKVKLSKNN